MAGAAPSLTGLAVEREEIRLRAAPLPMLRAAGRRVVLAVLGVALIIFIWWLISLGSASVRVPSPIDVGSTLWQDWGSIPALTFIAFQAGGIGEAVRFTTINVILGVLFGSLAGFVLGAVLGRVRLARELLEAPLLVLGTIPILTLLPFLVIWFGTARLVQSALVIIFALITVAAVVQQATLDVGQRYTQYAASLGAGGARILWEVVLPAVVPPTVGAVRVAAAAGWSFETVAELLGGQHGAGKLITAMQSLAATDVIIAVVLALGCSAVLLDALIAALGGLVVRWQE
jgi:sulfonate transport system permease protein